MSKDPVVGCLLGTAVGDALGLPYEGLSRKRAVRMLGPPYRHRFLFGHGMLSDDTEHASMVAETLLENGANVDRFMHRFAWKLRWWLLLLPAGIGRATLRSIVKLWLGFPPSRSGVFSAGNGPAMRAAIFGAAIDDLHETVALVKASTRVTHTDPKAEHGAIAVALAAWMAKRNHAVIPGQFRDQLSDLIGDEGDEFLSLIDRLVQSVTSNESTKNFADSLGLQQGVTGYTYHTVPVVLHAWLSNQQDYEKAVTTMIECGGDADTTAAIIGGITGTSVGPEGIPEQWKTSLCEWPRSLSYMERLGTELQKSTIKQVTKRLRLNPFLTLVRNLVLVVVVLFHGFRRLFPPYERYA